MNFNNCSYCGKNTEYYVKCIYCHKICCDNCYVYGNQEINCLHKYDEIPKNEPITNPNDKKVTEEKEYIRLIKTYPKINDDVEKSYLPTDFKEDNVNDK